MRLRSLAPAAGVLFVTLLAVDAPRAAAKASASPSREATALANLLELASSPRFSLVLEPGSSRLVLMLEGAVLRDYPVEASEVVAPRVAFFWRRADPAAPDSQWIGQIWHGGELHPPRKRDRIEVNAMPPDSNRAEGAVEVPVPPPPEEAILAPERYFVRFSGGMALEIRAASSGRIQPDTWKFGWEDRLAAIRRHPADRVRLRLSLAPDDSDALYRSLPPDVSLLVLPPTLRADGSDEPKGENTARGS